MHPQKLERIGSYHAELTAIAATSTRSGARARGGAHCARIVAVRGQTPAARAAACGVGPPSRVARTMRSRLSGVRRAF